MIVQVRWISLPCRAYGERAEEDPWTYPTSAGANRKEQVGGSEMSGDLESTDYHTTACWSEIILSMQSKAAIEVVDISYIFLLRSA